MGSAFTASRAFLFSIFAALLVLCSSEVLAQAASQTLNQRLAGTWMLVSAHDTQKDGTDIRQWLGGLLLILGLIRLANRIE